MQLVRDDKLRLFSVCDRKSNILELLALSTALALFACRVSRFFHRVTEPQLLTLVRLIPIHEKNTTDTNLETLASSGFLNFEF